MKKTTKRGISIRCKPILSPVILLVSHIYLAVLPSNLQLLLPYPQILSFRIGIGIQFQVLFHHQHVIILWKKPIAVLVKEEACHHFCFHFPALATNLVHLHRPTWTWTAAILKYEFILRILVVVLASDMKSCLVAIERHKNQSADHNNFLLGKTNKQSLSLLKYVCELEILLALCFAV